jgi:hypothetical protein
MTNDLIHGQTLTKWRFQERWFLSLFCFLLFGRIVWTQWMHRPPLPSLSGGAVRASWATSELLEQRHILRAAIRRQAKWVPPEKLHFLRIYKILGRHIATATLWDVRLHIHVFSFSKISLNCQFLLQKWKKRKAAIPLFHLLPYYVTLYFALAAIQRPNTAAWLTSVAVLWIALWLLVHSNTPPPPHTHTHTRTLTHTHTHIYTHSHTHTLTHTHTHTHTHIHTLTHWMCLLYKTMHNRWDKMIRTSDQLTFILQ